MASLIEKITFLLDNDLEIITLVVSFLFGSVFAIPNALKPSNPFIIPLAPMKATIISMFGNLFQILILISITILICYLLSKTNFILKLKQRYNTYFYTKFNRTPYGLYTKSQASTLVLFLSFIPFLSPIISSLIGYSINLDYGNIVYLHIIGLVINNMLLTLFSFNNITRLISIIFFVFAILYIFILISLPFLRLEKKIK